MNHNSKHNQLKEVIYIKELSEKNITKIRIYMYQYVEHYYFICSKAEKAMNMIKRVMQDVKKDQNGI